MSTAPQEHDSNALETLEALLLRVQVPVAAERVWDRMLTREDREQFHNDLATALHEGGTVGMWARLRSVSPRQAVLDLALGLNLTDAATATWLRRELQLVESQDPHAATIPVWDRERRELRFAGAIVRRVMRPNQARNIVAVLDAFQEEGWPPRILDPLPDGRDVQRLHRTISVLNTKLTAMRFSADGTGEGFAWMPTV